MPQTGSLGQIVYGRPSPDEISPETRASDVFIEMRSMAQESALSAGISETFSLCQIKTSLPNEGDTPWERIHSWSALEFHANQAFVAGFEGNANVRRNLPA